ncbi:MAG: heme A synthase [Pirellulales bacterium]
MHAAVDTAAPDLWPHRWAVALVCATFPLIWVGGLVTSYDAGMAVPDWPNTYGYNLFLYPWQTWLYGPWGLFIEHGHRLLGATVGMLAIGLVTAAWWYRSSKLARWLSVAALAGVILQGALGGMRVMADEVQLAKIHGCVGPAFFALAVAVAVVTSRQWREGRVENRQALGAVERYAVITTLLAYCQLVIGAQLRHLPPGASLGDFRLALVFHLAVAAALLAHVVLLAAAVWRTQSREWPLVRPALALVALLLVQLGLGSGAWVTKYGWPSWLSDYGFAAGYTVTADSALQAWITTAHVATGSLILAASLLVALRSVRFAWHNVPSAHSADSWLMEAAR